MGDVSGALIIGAAIQATYMGWFAAGPGIPSDQALATYITVPLAMVAGMSPEMAVTLAVPVGLLGVLLHNLRRTINAVFPHMADKFAENGDVRGIYRAAYLYPALLMIPLHVVPVAVLTYLGPTVARSFIESLPTWLVHGLEVAGGMMPAMGFAMGISVIGRKKLMPYFLAGFLISRTVPSLSSITLVVFAVILGTLHVQYTQKRAVT